LRIASKQCSPSLVIFEGDGAPRCSIDREIRIKLQNLCRLGSCLLHLPEPGIGCSEPKMDGPIVWRSQRALLQRQQSLRILLERVVR